MIGILPFGLICGAVCSSVGIPEWGGGVMSIFIFAGASQLVATQLMSEHASSIVIIFTGLVINARFVMYSASIAEHFRGVHPLKKMGLAYVLTDQAYAMSINRFKGPEADHTHKVAYFLGAALLMGIAFISTSFLGSYIGALIPPEWELDFAVPLTFTALIIPAVQDRPTLLAAVVAGGLSAVTDSLPYNLGLLTAALCGIIAGTLAERRQTRG